MTQENLPQKQIPGYGGPARVSIQQHSGKAALEHLRFSIAQADLLACELELGVLCGEDRGDCIKELRNLGISMSFPPSRTSQPTCLRGGLP